MPYCLDGTIDFYGRYNRIHPVPFSSGTEDDKKTAKNIKRQEEVLSLIKLKCIYGPVLYEDEVNEKLLTESCVLLHDYTKQLSQTIIPRKEINNAIISVEAETIAFLRTRLLIATGVEGMRVADADTNGQVDTAARALYKAALEGKPFTSIISSIEIQEFMNKSGLDAQSFTLALQSLDNLRLSGYGLNNGGLFEKKAHELGEEAEMNEINTSIILNDGLKIRQNFCNIVNSIWGLGVWCEPSESLTGVDVNGDGTSYDSDSEGSQSSPEGGEGGNDNE